MIRKRIIPVLQLDGEKLVKTVLFKRKNYVGDPINAVRIFNDLEVDELIILDISINYEIKETLNFKFLKNLASECFMPLSYGGGIKNIIDAEKIFKLGFEKIIVNTSAFENKLLLEELIKNFGSQSIVHSIDVKKNFFNNYNIYIKNGERKLKIDLFEWLKKVEDLGVGELIITNIGKEGTWSGYDNNLIESVSKRMSMPVIANGGCGSIEHIKEIFKNTKVSAAAAGSIFVYQKKGMGVLINYLNNNELKEILFL